MLNNKLVKIRQQIDKIDEQIIDLLERRMVLVAETKKLKSQITDTARENEILEKVKSKYIKTIYKAILKTSKEYQQDLI